MMRKIVSVIIIKMKIITMIIKIIMITIIIAIKEV